MNDKILNFCFVIVRFCFKFLPLKNTIIFESKPDFSDNSLSLYHEIIKRGYNKKYKIVWLLNGKEKPSNLPENVYVKRRIYGSILEKLSVQWEIAQAKYIVDSNNFVYKYKKRQVRFHLKHGLPMKDATHYNKTIGEIDALCVPSDYWIDVCSKEHGVPKTLVKPLGFPRNDILVPQTHKHKTIIWMPTFRNSSHDSTVASDFDYNSIMPFGIPTISDANQLQEINDIFRENSAYLLVRLHPAQQSVKNDLKEMSNIKICNDDFLRKHNTTLYKLLSYTDALISDYSSIYYDYLLLNNPIALVTFDFEHYKKHNGILSKNYEDFKNNFPAFFIENYSDLIEFIENIFKDNSRVYNCAEAQKKYMSGCDNHSAEKIVNYLIEKYNL